MVYQKNYVKSLVGTNIKPKVPQLTIKNPLKKTLYVNAIELTPNVYFSKKGKVTIKINGDYILREDVAGSYANYKLFQVPLNHQELLHQKKIEIEVWNGIDSDQVQLTCNVLLTEERNSVNQSGIPLSQKELNELISDGVSVDTKETIDAINNASKILGKIESMESKNLQLIRTAIDGIEVTADNTDVIAELKEIVQSVKDGAFSSTDIVTEIDKLVKQSARLKSDSLGVTHAKNIMKKDSLSLPHRGRDRISQTILDVLYKLSDGFDIDEIDNALSILINNRGSLSGYGGETNDALLNVIANLQHLKVTNTVQVVSELTKVKTGISELDTTEKEKLGKIIDGITSLKTSEENKLDAVKLAIEGLKDGFDSAELKTAIDTVKKAIDGIEVTADNADVITALTTVQGAIEDLPNTMPDPTAVKDSERGVIFPHKIYHNEIHTQLIDMAGNRNAIVTMSGSHVDVPVIIPHDFAVDPTPPGFTLIHKMGAHVPGVLTPTTRGRVRFRETTEFGTLLLPDGTDNTKRTHAWTSDYILLDCKYSRRKSLRFFFDSGYPKIMTFSKNVTILDTYTRTREIIYVSQHTGVIQYRHGPKVGRYNENIIKSVRLAYTSEIIIEESNFSDFRQSTFLEKFIPIKGDNGKAIISNARYLRFKVITKVAVSSISTLKTSNGSYRHAVESNVVVAYDKSYARVHQITDTLAVGGQAKLSFQVLDANNEWREFIGSDEIGTIVSGKSVVREFGEANGNHILPSSQTLLRALLEVRGGIQTGVSFILVS